MVTEKVVEVELSWTTIKWYDRERLLEDWYKWNKKTSTKKSRIITVFQRWEGQNHPRWHAQDTVKYTFRKNPTESGSKWEGRNFLNRLFYKNVSNEGSTNRLNRQSWQLLFMILFVQLLLSAILLYYFSLSNFSLQWHFLQ